MFLWLRMFSKAFTAITRKSCFCIVDMWNWVSGKRYLNIIGITHEARKKNANLLSLVTLQIYTYIVLDEWKNIPLFSKTLYKMSLQLEHHSWMKIIQYICCTHLEQNFCWKIFCIYNFHVKNRQTSSNSLSEKMLSMKWPFLAFNET